MQRAYRKCLLADERIEQRRLSGAHTTENRQVQMSVFELVEHCLDIVIVVGEGLANAIRKARVTNKLAQAFPCKCQVTFAAVRPGVGFRPLFAPGPFWQRAERPLQYVH